MTTFLEVVEALIASREHCAGSLGRMQFWVDQFGHLPTLIHSMRRLIHWSF